MGREVELAWSLERSEHDVADLLGAAPAAVDIGDEHDLAAPHRERRRVRWAHHPSDLFDDVMGGARVVDGELRLRRPRRDRRGHPAPQHRGRRDHRLARHLQLERGACELERPRSQHAHRTSLTLGSDRPRDQRHPDRQRAVPGDGLDLSGDDVRIEAEAALAGGDPDGLRGADHPGFLDGTWPGRPASAVASFS